MEHGLKDIGFYVQKHITTRAVSHNFLLVHDKPPRGARICEAILLFATMSLQTRKPYLHTSTDLKKHFW